MNKDIFLSNTLGRKKEKFVPINVNKIGMYVCGPTVYDDPHIGNARPLVIFDLLFKVLKCKYGKKSVTYVRNITDIDDKIIKASLENNISIFDLTNKISKNFYDDCNYLNCEVPTHEPRATENIDLMIKMVQELIKNGFAYEKEKNVYFNVGEYKDYGKLSNKNLEDLIAGSRVEISENKDNPEDFVLWKPSKKNEPGWKSPWGYGRPGWHTECFAMASDILKTPFDIHGGGLDLKFPHHDNEIAQSCCFQNTKDDFSSYARFWMHNGFVTIEEKKMSKSLGNIVLLKDYLNVYNGEVIRLALLSAHYRSPLVWTESLITQSKKILDKFYDVLSRLEGIEVQSDNLTLPSELQKCLFDDLNISKAFAYLNKIIRNKESFETDKNKKKLKRILMTVSNILGIFKQSPKNWFKNKIKIDSMDIKNIEELVQKRNIARKNKDYNLADDLRKKLINLGVEIQDSPDGVKWKWVN